MSFSSDIDVNPVQEWFIATFTKHTSYEPPVLWALIEGVLKNVWQQSQEEKVAECAKTLSEFLEGEAASRANEHAVQLLDKVEEHRRPQKSNSDRGDRNRDSEERRGAHSDSDDDDSKERGFKRGSDSRRSRSRSPRRSRHSSSRDSRRSRDHDRYDRHSRHRHSSRHGDRHSHSQDRYGRSSRHDDGPRRSSHHRQMPPPHFGAPPPNMMSARQADPSGPPQQFLNPSSRLAPPGMASARMPPNAGMRSGGYGSTHHVPLQPPPMGQNAPRQAPMGRGGRVPRHPQMPSPFVQSSQLRQIQQTLRADGSASANATPGAPPNSVLVENIPREKNKLITLNEHFSRFGEVTGCNIDLYANKAVVTFRTYRSVATALRSPEAVFNNRFVRVSNANAPPQQQQQQQQGGPVPRGSGRGGAPYKGATTLSGEKRSREHASVTVTETSDGRRVVNLGGPDVKRRATHSSAPLSVEERQRKIMELRKKKVELREQQIAQQKRLLGMLDNKSLSDTDRAKVMTQLKELQKMIDRALKEERERVEAQAKTAQRLKARLQKQEEERKQRERLKQEKLDRELNAMAESNEDKGVVEGAAGNEDGAAEGEDGGEGGGGDGDDATVEALRAKRDLLKQQQQQQRKGGAHKHKQLDNRSALLRVSRLPAELQSEEALRTHAQQYGTVVRVECDGDKGAVQFEARRSAENALLKTASASTFVATIDESAVRNNTNNNKNTNNNDDNNTKEASATNEEGNAAAADDGATDIAEK